MAAAPLFEIPTEKVSSELLLKIPIILCWSWSNLLLFNIHNQRDEQSVLTDRMSKPWRPIPSQRISAEESRKLLFVIYPVLGVFCLEFGGLGPFLAEALVCYLALIFFSAFLQSSDTTARIKPRTTADFCFLSGVSGTMSGTGQKALSVGISSTQPALQHVWQAPLSLSSGVIMS